MVIRKTVEKCRWTVKHWQWRRQSLPQRPGSGWRWKWVFWSQYGSAAVKCHLAEEVVPPRIRIGNQGSPENLQHLVTPIYLWGQWVACHPSTYSLPQTSPDRPSERGSGEPGFHYRDLVMWTSLWTFNFSLGRSMLEKSWQFIHFAPSWSQLMSDWRDPPSLMLYSLESAPAVKKNFIHPN